MINERELFDLIADHEKKGNRDAIAQETLVLGLLHFYKWDHATDWMRQSGVEMIDAARLQSFIDQHTERQLGNFRLMAADTLKDYARRHPPRHEFWYGVAQSLVAAFLYSFALWIIYQILKAGNIDLFTLLSSKVTFP